MMLNGSLKSYIHRKRLKQQLGDGGGVVANLPPEVGERDHNNKKTGGGSSALLLRHRSDRRSRNSSSSNSSSKRSRKSSHTSTTSSLSNSSVTSLTSGATNECPEVPLIPKKKHYEIVIVACGCFWNPQLRFKKVCLMRTLARYIYCTSMRADALVFFCCIHRIVSPSG